jgi:oligoendopeptidase F
VASTFNEALLLRRMLDKAANDDERLFLLGNYLENLRGTFFRQAMFAERAAIRGIPGEALTGTKLTKCAAAASALPRQRSGGPHPRRVRWRRTSALHYNFSCANADFVAASQLARG